MPHRASQLQREDEDAGHLRSPIGPPANAPLPPVAEPDPPASSVGGMAIGSSMGWPSTPDPATAVLIVSTRSCRSSHADCRSKGPEVELDARRRRELVAPLDLRGPGEAGPNGEALALPLVIPLDLVRQGRPRPDDAHLAFEHVDQLRELVEREPSQDPTDPRDPRRVGVQRVAAVDRGPSSGTSAPRTVAPRARHAPGGRRPVPRDDTATATAHTDPTSAAGTARPVRTTRSKSRLPGYGTCWLGHQPSLVRPVPRGTARARAAGPPPCGRRRTPSASR